MQVPPRQKKSTVALALAGGGPEGAVYEIAALRALDEAIEGLDCSKLPIYVGISAGAFVGSCLANGMTTAALCRTIIRSEPGRASFPARAFSDAGF